MDAPSPSEPLESISPGQICADTPSRLCDRQCGDAYNGKDITWDLAGLWAVRGKAEQVALRLRCG